MTQAMVEFRKLLDRFHVKVAQYTEGDCCEDDLTEARAAVVAAYEAALASRPWHEATDAEYDERCRLQARINELEREKDDGKWNPAPWAVQLPVITHEIADDLYEDHPGVLIEHGIGGYEWTQTAVDFACMLQVARKEALASRPTSEPVGVDERFAAALDRFENAANEFGFIEVEHSRDCATIHDYRTALTKEEAARADVLALYKEQVGHVERIKRAADQHFMRAEAASRPTGEK